MAEIRQKLVLTRPYESSIDFAEKLYQGIHKEKYFKENISDYSQFKERFLIVSPVMDIHHLHPPLPGPSDFDALIVTSVNAFTPEVLAEGYQKTPLYVVGRATASHALQMGFENIRAVEQTVQALTERLKTENKGQVQRYVYLRGKDVSQDMISTLPSDSCAEYIVYEAVARERFSPALEASLHAEEVLAVTFFSVRSAIIFCDIARDCGYSEVFRRIKALCISGPVLECVQSFFGNGVYVSDAPDASSMLNLVQNTIIKGYSS